jgi:hypothetical protein
LQHHACFKAFFDVVIKIGAAVFGDGHGDSDGGGVRLYNFCIV